MGCTRPLGVLRMDGAPLEMSASTPSPPPTAPCCTTRLAILRAVANCMRFAGLNQSAHGKATATPPDECVWHGGTAWHVAVGHAPGASPATKRIPLIAKLSTSVFIIGNTSRQHARQSGRGGQTEPGLGEVAAPLVTAAALSSAPATLSP